MIFFLFQKKNCTRHPNSHNALEPGQEKKGVK